MKKIIIIAPATSIGLFPKEAKEVIAYLESKGIEVVIAPNAKKSLENCLVDEFNSTPAKERAEDFVWAFNQDADAILCFVGGYNSNELLDLINWKAIRESSIKFIGHSDITVLTNAIYSKLGLVTWTGISGINFAVKESRQTTYESLQYVLNNESIDIAALKVKQESFDAPIQKAEGWKYLNARNNVSGKIIGGNLDTIGLLQGTEYMPRFTSPTILAIEEDDLTKSDTLYMFKRSLVSLFMQDGAIENIKAIICGRFPESTTTIDMKKIENLFKSLDYTKDLPVLINVEIDHCLPKVLLPIGKNVTILNKKEPTIRL